MVGDDGSSVGRARRLRCQDVVADGQSVDEALEAPARPNRELAGDILSVVEHTDLRWVHAGRDLHFDQGVAAGDQVSAIREDVDLEAGSDSVCRRRGQQQQRNRNNLPLPSHRDPPGF
jgi:hypothetical protein